MPDFYVSGEGILGGRVTLDSLLLAICFTPEEKQEILMFAKCSKSGDKMLVSDCTIKRMDGGYSDENE